MERRETQGSTESVTEVSGYEGLGHRIFARHMGITCVTPWTTGKPGSMLRFGIKRFALVDDIQRRWAVGSPFACNRDCFQHLVFFGATKDTVARRSSVARSIPGKVSTPAGFQSVVEESLAQVESQCERPSEGTPNGAGTIFTDPTTQRMNATSSLAVEPLSATQSTSVAALNYVKSIAPDTKVIGSLQAKRSVPREAAGSVSSVLAASGDSPTKFVGSFNIEPREDRSVPHTTAKMTAGLLPEVAQVQSDHSSIPTNSSRETAWGAIIRQRPCGRVQPERQTAENVSPGASASNLPSRDASPVDTNFVPTLQLSAERPLTAGSVTGDVVQTRPAKALTSSEPAGVVISRHARASLPSGDASPADTNFVPTLQLSAERPLTAGSVTGDVVQTLPAKALTSSEPPGVVISRHAGASLSSPDASRVDTNLVPTLPLGAERPLTARSVTGDVVQTRPAKALTSSEPAGVVISRHAGASHAVRQPARSVPSAHAQSPANRANEAGGRPCSPVQRVTNSTATASMSAGTREGDSNGRILRKSEHSEAVPVWSSRSANVDTPRSPSQLSPVAPELQSESQHTPARSLDFSAPLRPTGSHGVGERAESGAGMRLNQIISLHASSAKVGILQRAPISAISAVGNAAVQKHSGQVALTHTDFGGHSNSSPLLDEPSLRSSNEADSGSPGNVIVKRIPAPMPAVVPEASEAVAASVRTSGVHRAGASDGSVASGKVLGAAKLDKVTPALDLSRSRSSVIGGSLIQRVAWGNAGATTNVLPDSRLPASVGAAGETLALTHRTSAILQASPMFGSAASAVQTKPILASDAGVGPWSPDVAETIQRPPTQAGDTISAIPAVAAVARPNQGAGWSHTPATSDVATLANRVYDLLVQRLARERQRRGL